MKFGKILRSAFAVLIAFLPGLFASGQVKFTTVVSSQELGQSDYLQVEFQVENARQIEEMTPPDFSGFRIVQGPIQSSTMSIVNGNSSLYKGLSYVLQPVRTGKFIIGGATAIVDGQKMKSNAVTIIVHAGGTGAPPANSGNGGGFMPQGFGFGPDPFSAPEPEEVDRDYILKPGENVKEKIRKNLFLKVQVDRNSCYVGEPIVATYKLYSRLNSESRVTRRPSLNGFSVYDMIDPSRDAVSVEKINGKAFTVHTIRKTQLIPLQAGNIDLDPLEVENTVHFVKGGVRQEPRRSGNSLRDLLDQLSGNDSYGPEVDENITLDTKPVTITVKPLPDANKPANYTGAVGSFSVTASLANKSVTAEDEATLHVVVKGKGNLPVVEAPAVNWPSGIDAFDPTAKEDVNNTVVPMSGSKSFDYTFTAKDPGHYTIPAVSLSYFDPSSQTYKTAGSQPLDLQVTPSFHKGRRPSSDSALTAAASAAGSGMDRFFTGHLATLIAVLACCCLAFYFWRQNRGKKEAGTAAAAAAAGTIRTGTGAGMTATGAAMASGAAVSGTTASGGTASGTTASGTAASGMAATGMAATGASITSPAKTDISNAPVSPSKAANPAPSHSPAKAAHSSATPAHSPATYVPMAAKSDPLIEARQFYDNGDYKSFYREVNRAIWKSIGKKLDLPSSELNKHNVVHQLELRGWDAPSILSLENILVECELNLYTPAYDTYNMQQLLRQAEWMLDRLA